ncbi:MAG: D-alanine--D-alanine ligase [Acidobacteria bacterium]|nr:D-alanine--D-alanine ligase [Acidobacteriota bacterium]
MKTRVAIIYGGRSGEHEISLRSAESIMGALDRERYKIIHYKISKDGAWSPRPISPEPGKNPEIDVVFPVLHGTFGEDGTVQGLLELADLAYVSAGVLASSAAMDKEVTKRLCRDAGLPVVDYVVVGCAAGEIAIPFDFPVFVKPVNLGSSVGVAKARNAEEMREAVREASQYDRRVIIERAIAGQEVECAVMGNEDPVAATPCEILPSRDFYDYEDKYLLDQAETRIPANLSPEMLEAVRRLAVACYRAVNCEVMARVDFLVESATGRVYINEINTIPGFTSISMFPKMWEHAGIAYAQLLDRLIEYAVARHEQKRRLRYTK